MKIWFFLTERPVFPLFPAPGPAAREGGQQETRRRVKKYRYCVYDHHTGCLSENTPRVFSLRFSVRSGNGGAAQNRPVFSSAFMKGGYQT